MLLTLETEDSQTTSLTRTFTGKRTAHRVMNFTDIPLTPTLNSRSHPEASNRQDVVSNWHTGPTACVVE